MSKLRLPSGDDHPEAAGKHLADAEVLLDKERPDGAMYLSGYVIECALKALLLHEESVPAAGGAVPWRRGGAGHDLQRLHADVATLAVVAGAKTARYFGATITGLLTLPIATWNPEQRYRPPEAKQSDAESWVADARKVFHETVGAMLKDGVL
jgi:HEPN domain-containing protein